MNHDKVKQLIAGLFDRELWRRMFRSM